MDNTHEDNPVGRLDPDIRDRDAVNGKMAALFDQMLQRIGNGPRIIVSSDGLFSAIAVSGNDKTPRHTHEGLGMCFMSSIFTMIKTLESHPFAKFTRQEILFLLDRIEMMVEDETFEQHNTIISTFVERDVSTPASNEETDIDVR